MTLRMVAGDRLIGRRRARVREPTGSPVATYCSTISRKTAAERASRPGGSGGGVAGKGCSPALEAREAAGWRDGHVHRVDSNPSL